MYSNLIIETRSEKMEGTETVGVNVEIESQGNALHIAIAIDKFFKDQPAVYKAYKQIKISQAYQGGDIMEKLDAIFKQHGIVKVVDEGDPFLKMTAQEAPELDEKKLFGRMTVYVGQLKDLKDNKEVKL
ncbi:MAG TPA: hypothetical protein DCL77_14450 [Prolixibacteraceae bacterium]|jgi:hypothetical protein|nr:hypothetical protein [Prolixibacteraceae bacterium]